MFRPPSNNGEGTFPSTMNGYPIGFEQSAVTHTHVEVTYAR